MVSKSWSKGELLAQCRKLEKEVERIAALTILPEYLELIQETVEDYEDPADRADFVRSLKSNLSWFLLKCVKDQHQFSKQRKLSNANRIYRRLIKTVKGKANEGFVNAYVNPLYLELGQTMKGGGNPYDDDIPADVLARFQEIEKQAREEV